MINTEWGALGDDGGLDFIMTDYDRQVDKHSINAGRQM
jgi:hexokinase